jgi:hypothetical protein
MLSSFFFVIVRSRASGSADRAATMQSIQPLARRKIEPGATG